jgi:hypothetical protein
VRWRDCSIDYQRRRGENCNLAIGKQRVGGNYINVSMSASPTLGNIHGGSPRNELLSGGGVGRLIPRLWPRLRLRFWSNGLGGPSAIPASGPVVSESSAVARSLLLDLPCLTSVRRRDCIMKQVVQVKPTKFRSDSAQKDGVSGVFKFSGHNDA